MFGRSKVKMVLSVGPYAAGTTVRLPEGQADEYILKGYAEGVLSRQYSDEEANVLRSTAQNVSV